MYLKDIYKQHVDIGMYDSTVEQNILQLSRDVMNTDSTSVFNLCI